MKILFLPVYHYPEKAASLYMGDNAREAYAAKGWEMKVICPSPSRGVDDETRRKYINSPDSEELNGAVKVRRFKLYREGKGILGRVLRYFICQGRHYRLARKEKNVDVLFVSSTPPIQGLLMTRVKRILGCKTVYNLQDIFPDSLVNAGITRKGSLVWKLGRLIENKTYYNADKIVVISERFKRNIMEKGVPEEKITVIRNWVDDTAIVPVKRDDNPLFDRLGLEKACFYVTYCGNIGKSQNLELLVNVAYMLRDETDIKFIIIGEGVCRDELESKVNELGLDNIRLINFLPQEDIRYVFGMGNVGLVISKPGIGTSSVPSKTWSIMCAERAVLASFDIDSELGDIISKSGCGVCLPPDDAIGLVETIKELRDNPSLCERYGRNGRNYVLANLTKDVGCSKLTEVIGDLVKEKA